MPNQLRSDDLSHLLSNPSKMSTNEKLGQEIKLSLLGTLLLLLLIW